MNPFRIWKGDGVMDFDSVVVDWEDNEDDEV